MDISTIFSIKDNVKIIPLNKNGVIKSIFISSTGISYNVRYFENLEPKEVYFFEEELELSSIEERRVGFKVEKV